MGVVLTVAERAKINRKVCLETRCVAVGRSGEVPLLEVFKNGSIIIWKTFRSMRDGRCRESGRSSEARCREVPL